MGVVGAAVAPPGRARRSARCPDPHDAADPGCAPPAVFVRPEGASRILMPTAAFANEVLPDVLVERLAGVNFAPTSPTRGRPWASRRTARIWRASSMASISTPRRRRACPRGGGTARSAPTSRSARAGSTSPARPRSASTGCRTGRARRRAAAGRPRSSAPRWRSGARNWRPAPLLRHRLRQPVRAPAVAGRRASRASACAMRPAPWCATRAPASGWACALADVWVPPLEPRRR